MVQQPKNLHKLLLTAISPTNEISTYSGTIKKSEVEKQIIRLKKAFPQLQNSFYKMFMERISAKGKGDKWLIDAVNHVIDTCIYPMPTIAQFLSYDVKIQLYTWDEVSMGILTGRIWDEYEKIKIENKIYYILKK